MQSGFFSFGGGEGGGGLSLAWCFESVKKTHRPFGACTIKMILNPGQFYPNFIVQVRDCSLHLKNQTRHNGLCSLFPPLSSRSFSILYTSVLTYVPSPNVPFILSRKAVWQGGVIAGGSLSPCLRACVDWGGAVLCFAVPCLAQRGPPSATLLHLLLWSQAPFPRVGGKVPP